MTRLADAILSGEFTEGYSAPMVDLRLGAQQGHAPDLGAFLNNQAYVPRPLIPLLMEAPLGMDYLPDPQFRIAALKSLMETQAKSISGLNSTLTVETAEHIVGNGGEMQEEYTKVSRQRSNPSYTWQNRYGNAIGNYWDEYILMLINDPDTMRPGIAMLADLPPTDLLADMYSFTMLFIEPDPTGTSVVKAFLVTNMFPKNGAETTARREMGSSMETPEVQIEFTGLTQSNLGVRLLAQAMLDNIRFANSSPMYAPAFLQGISADVAAAGTGYATRVEEMGATAIL